MLVVERFVFVRIFLNAFILFILMFCTTFSSSGGVLSIQLKNILNDLLKNNMDGALSGMTRGELQ